MKYVIFFSLKFQVQPLDYSDLTRTGPPPTVRPWILCSRPSRTGATTFKQRNSGGRIYHVFFNYHHDHDHTKP